MTGVRGWMGRVTLAAVGYFLLGWAGLGLAVTPGYASVVWPAAGLALVAILLDGRRLWPGVWLGSFLVSISAAVERTGSWRVEDVTLPCLIATGAVVQACIGAGLLRRFVSIPLLLVKPREIWLVFAVVGPIHCLVNATWSVLWMSVLGVSAWHDFPSNWCAWWVGDSLGAVVAMLLLMTFFGKPRSLWRPRLATVALPMVIVLSTTIAVFSFGRGMELGFALAIMIAVTQLTSSGQTFLVEAEVQKRTWELTQEIQERERIQAALTRSEADTRKLALIADRTDNLAVLTDAQGRIEWVNAGFTRVTGYTLDEVKGQSPGLLLQGPETDQRTVTHMRECLRRGDGFRVEILNYTKSGRKYWLFIEVQPLRDEDGRLIRFMAIESDITERKMAEHALRDSESKLAAVISTAMDGFWESDREGRILSVNDAYCRTSGYTREELLRLRITNLEAVETPEETMRHIKKIFAEGSDRFETRHRRKDGSVYDVEISVRFVPEWDHSFVFVQDISARKQAQDQLQLAKESAEAANSAKSVFLANVSHEIRTPMNGILGMAELLLREVTTARQRDRLEVIQNSAGALLSVINDLLDLSRIEAGKLTLEMRPFELRKELTQIINLVADSANRRGLKVELVIATAVARHVVGDAGRLRQVLFNLIGNAIKFTERGSVEVRVYKPAHRDPHLIAFAVTDTGVGIPADKLTDIFRPFEQVDSSVTRRFGGTGLGLSISSRLVEAMGGTIDVESTPGKGSTFTFSAPLEPCAASEAKSYPTDASNWSAGVRPLHVLLAEDNAVNQLVAKDMLHQAGHRVRVASSGREVLAALDEERFDVALMDVQMPEMDGLEATEAIRRREAAEGGHLPIIALTAMAVRDDEDRCRRAGMDGFITKPIDWAELGHALREHCGTAGSPAVTVDRETVLARMGGKLPLVKQVLDVFVKNYPQQIAEMRAAIEAKQTQQLSRAAHKLVGGLGNFDQGAGLKRARDLEATGPAGDLAAASAAVEQLEEYLARLVLALRAWLT